MFKKIIWSVDPHQTDRRLWNQTISFLDFLSRSLGVVIEPVYVATPVETGLPNACRTFTEKKLKGLKLAKLSKPLVIFDKKSVTVTSATQNLSRHSVKTGADAIVIGTHSRSGLERFFLGSFAETLLYHSKTPVLIVGLRTQKKTRVSKILFATDFTADSAKDFERLLPLAKKLKSEILLFHSIEDMSRYGNAFDFPAAIEEIYQLTQALKVQTNAASQKMDQFVQLAKSSGVKIKTLVEKNAQSPGAAILKAAKKSKADLIALGTQSGPYRAALGSVARTVVRKSPLPVWVYPR